ncbi:MAG TPA: acyl carrier protein [Pseudonocardiaceae bacterium]|nr:acyl carrier protein [Pseudonocardiaceae bacterium]
MKAGLAQDAVVTVVTEFVREKFLAGDPDGELQEDTNLLQLGILDSLNTAVLMTFIRDDLDVVIPLEMISAGNFKTVRSIASMICSSAVPSGV